MNRVKETLCTKCAHSDVCFYKKRYLEALRMVEAVLVDFNDIRVAPIELRCEFYLMKAEMINEKSIGHYKI